MHTQWRRPQRARGAEDEFGSLVRDGLLTLKAAWKLESRSSEGTSVVRQVEPG